MLSPLYDFAPMFLDPQGISRASIWNDEALEKRGSGRPNWSEIVIALRDLLDPKLLGRFFADLSTSTRRLPSVMGAVGIEEQVVIGVAARCEEIADDLEATRKL